MRRACCGLFKRGGVVTDRPAASYVFPRSMKKTPGGHIAGSNANEAAVILLEKLTGIGRETAVVLTREVFCRDFRDRRGVAAFAGLAPSPYRSGRLRHEQGISKAGNSLVRARLVQLAWRWVRFQNDSNITAWFIQRTGGESRRSRRVAIVAVARKLLVALWRYATQGLVPEGARLKPAAAG